MTRCSMMRVAVAFALTLALPAFAIAAPTNLVTNADFETNESTTAPAGQYASATPGDWQGDVTDITTAQDGITPFSGVQMLHFINTEIDGPRSGSIGSELLQSVDLGSFGINPSVESLTARLTARYNRVPGDAQTDTQFRVEIRAFTGDVTSFPTQIATASDIARNSAAIVTDGDVSTWEAAMVELALPSSTDFLGFFIQSIENVVDDGSNPEFDGHYADFVSLTVVPEPSLVDLDIRPGSDQNPINLSSRGVLPVAILSDGEFDALNVDVDTILFGDPVLLDGGAIGVAPFRSTERDVDHDGLTDLTLQFSIRDLVDNGALGDMSGEAILTGETFDGTPFEGSDSIRLVPPGDANNDQIVDGADYTVWANNFGTNGNGTPGDFDEDNHVDGADYTMWANNFGTDISAPGSAAAAVPEPSTLVLSALGLIGLLAYGPRRRRRT